MRISRYTAGKILCALAGLLMVLEPAVVRADWDWFKLRRHHRHCRFPFFNRCQECERWDACEPVTSCETEVIYPAQPEFMMPAAPAAVDQQPLKDELQRLEQRNADLERQLGDLRDQQQRQLNAPRPEDDQKSKDLEDRVNRLNDELDRLRQKTADLQSRPQSESPPVVNLPAQTTDRLNRLADRYPGSFEFDPSTGLSRLNADVLFDTGRDELRPEAMQILSEFAKIFSDPEVRALNIFIEGHADNQPIGQPETMAKHPTNYHLSLHRANSVRRFLQQTGLDASRMSVAGFGEHRPRTSNMTAAGRQLNRRVEIFVRNPEGTAGMRMPNAGVYGTANWMPVTSPAASRTSTAQPGLRVPTAVQAWRAAGTFRR